MKKTKTKSIVLFFISLAAVVALGLLIAFGIGENHKGSAKNIILGLDLKGGVSITFQTKDGTPSAEDMSDTVEKLKLRVQDYSTESDVYQEGDDRITVDIPGQSDAEAVLEKLGKPGSVQFVTNYKADNEKVWLSGADITDAQPTSQQNSSTGATEYVVKLTLSAGGTAAFKQATTEFLNKVIYVVYDGNVVSSPTVSTVISDGSAVITGMSTYEDAEQLASVIRIGSLNVELEELSSKVVGAKLGEDAISSSLFAGMIGLAIIIIFMICVYRVSGFAAGIALIIYTLLDLLFLNAFDMTLTLPGVAGIILSIGMAVDANVIVFARIKEELATGKTVEQSIKIGYKKATSAIVDGNITTLIAAVVLMVNGSGTVKGFAQTLAIGIVISMFTALVITRGIMYLLYNMGFDKVKFYGIQKARKTINFLGKKAICFTISIVCILSGLVGMFLNTTDIIEEKDTVLNYSVEFKGGLSTTVDFENAYTLNDFNDKIKPAIVKITGDSDVQGNAINGTNQFVIKTKVLDASVKNEIKKMLVKDYGAIENSIEEVSISSTVSGEMRWAAVIAVIIATFFMLIYIFIRFRDFRFASSAVIALIHDVLVVLAFYVISWTTVGNTFIACMLTIIGYSINATIVIFDRIRENLKNRAKDEDIKDLVNKSITQTLTRTIYSSFTTFVMVAVIYILGVTSIREFALPLMVGIIAGAYSSVCVTGALWYVMSKKKYEKIAK